MAWLDHTEAGGSTAFCMNGYERVMTPEKGAAAFWYFFFFFNFFSKIFKIGKYFQKIFENILGMIWKLMDFEITTQDMGAVQ